MSNERKGGVSTPHLENSFLLEIEVRPDDIFESQTRVLQLANHAMLDRVYTDVCTQENNSVYTPMPA